jgi:hypothetical protein
LFPILVPLKRRKRGSEGGKWERARGLNEMLICPGPAGEAMVMEVLAREEELAHTSIAKGGVRGEIHPREAAVIV